MSKKRNRSSTFRKRRDTNDIANRRLPLPSTIRPSQLDLVDFLRTIEDRREYHPDGHHFNAASLNRRTHTLVLPETTHHPVSNRSSRNSSKIPHNVAFAQPDKVLVCIRRKRREEVLHALQKTGKRGQRSPRRNYFSDITC